MCIVQYLSDRILWDAGLARQADLDLKKMEVLEERTGWGDRKRWRHGWFSARLFDSPGSEPMHLSVEQNLAETPASMVGRDCCRTAQWRQYISH